jgi:hypothetical protein
LHLAWHWMQGLPVCVTMSVCVSVGVKLRVNARVIMSQVYSIIITHEHECGKVGSGY